MADAAPELIGRLRRFGHELAADLFDREGLATVFMHARNVLTGTAMIAAGSYAAQHMERSLLPGLWTAHLGGYVVAGVGALLLMLNLVDGLRRLARRKYSAVLRVCAILVYVALSLRLTQVIVYFRAVP